MHTNNRQELKEVATLIRDYLMLQKRVAQIGEKLIELGWKPKQFTETGQPQIDESVLDQIIKDCKK